LLVKYLQTDFVSDSENLVIYILLR